MSRFIAVKNRQVVVDRSSSARSAGTQRSGGDGDGAGVVEFAGRR
jgi:hypothetical protein